MTSHAGDVINNRREPKALISQAEPVQAPANTSRSRYVAIATQPVHRLQIRPIVHK